MTRKFCDNCNEEITEERPEFPAPAKCAMSRDGSNYVLVTVQARTNNSIPKTPDLCLYCILDAINAVLDRRPKVSVA